MATVSVGTGEGARRRRGELIIVGRSPTISYVLILLYSFFLLLLAPSPVHTETAVAASCHPSIW
jgi:hypothetical protein